MRARRARRVGGSRRPRRTTRRWRSVRAAAVALEGARGAPRGRGEGGRRLAARDVGAAATRHQGPRRARPPTGGDLAPRSRGRRGIGREGRRARSCSTSIARRVRRRAHTTGAARRADAPASLWRARDARAVRRVAEEFATPRGRARSDGGAADEHAHGGITRRPRQLDDPRTHHALVAIAHVGARRSWRRAARGQAHAAARPRDRPRRPADARSTPPSAGAHAARRGALAARSTIA